MWLGAVSDYSKMMITPLIGPLLLLLLLVVVVVLEPQTAAQHGCHMLQLWNFKGARLGIR